MNEAANAPQDDFSAATGDDMPSLPPAPSQRPLQIGRYRIVKVLGEGSFGRVYLAHDDQLGRPVAIKVPRQPLACPADVEDYLAEARVVAGLDHPNIVPVHDVGTSSDGLPYVVSKVVEGSDLDHKMREGRLPQLAAAELVRTVAEALHYAHRQRLVHRDIKPANILIDAAGQPHVADFGIALKETQFGKGARFIGTPAYMSPEQARGEGHRVDGRSDIFSLGVIFYQLLTGRRPFEGESQTELLEQIKSADARPPRQLDDAIAKELERICLKALARKASERYTTAKDFADDLGHFLAEAPAKAGSFGYVAKAASFGEPGQSATPPAPADTGSDPRPLKIVPKGLRSFDAKDADFFLELLPGPRDRDGLPDSIRFWKNKIEETDPDNTFSIGLIYGPSGCGKSSLVKAGLLPRLSADVIAIYLEATDTETRLLNGLRKRCPALAAACGLADALAELRKGTIIPVDKKVLIVLDQFEQWLHDSFSRDAQRSAELISALRQCDGRHIQCIVMVRDDFWMAATRFMQELEIRLLEGQNSAAVDLFPAAHAEKVLAAFGRAFGVLPERAGDMTKDQRHFLEQTVAALAPEGKVICVRLAVLAEMMKAKPWTPAALKAVGGAEGVGVAFLEETFSAAGAPPQHRYHQNAARAVLRALLPESGTAIKGHKRSRDELLAVSGYVRRPKEFDELLRILDSDVRLITPTDSQAREGGAELARRFDADTPLGVACSERSEGRDGGVSTPLGQGSAAPTDALRGMPHGRFYQLTHDYLVPSLRDWLTRKQKETRRGRAELRLAELAALWTAKPQSRHLPAWWEWINIRLLTRKKEWTVPQRKMMRKGARFHALRATALALAFAAAVMASLYVRDQIIEQNKENHARALVQRLLDAKIGQVPGIIAEIEAYRQWADPLLRQEREKAAGKSPRKLHTSLALLAVDEEQVDYLYERLLSAEAQEVNVLVAALTKHKGKLLGKLWAASELPPRDMDGQRLRAATALASYDPLSSAWDKVREQIAGDLVAVDAVYLATWLDGLRNVREKLLPPLAAIFRDGKRPEAERSLATEILVDYAGDKPPLLADLLLDAADKQFVKLYAKLKEHGPAALKALVSELSKPADPYVLKVNGTIAAVDPEGKVFSVTLEAGQTYTMIMSGPDPNSMLILGDRTGKFLALGDSGGGGLNHVLHYTPAQSDSFKVQVAPVTGTGTFLLTIVAPGLKEKNSKRQANAGVALLKLGQADEVWPLLKHSPDPRARTYLIHYLSLLGADASALVKRLDEEPDFEIRRALILSLGEFADKDIPSAERAALVGKLQNVFQTAADPGLRAAAEWLLRHWNPGDLLLPEVDPRDKDFRDKCLTLIREELAREKEQAKPRWYINSQGQTMVVLPGPKKALMGSPLEEAGRLKFEVQHQRNISRTFAIAAKPVTVQQFLEFRKPHARDFQDYMPTDDCPVIGVDWYLAAGYCNWLSAQDGIPTDQWCYETDGQGRAGGIKSDYLKLTGYRLPTEAEWECACRAGTVTSRYYGEAEQLLGKYAWYLSNSANRSWPVGSKKPNDWGLFDMHGNVWVWCHDAYTVYPQAKNGILIEDNEGMLGITDQHRVLRGGSFNVYGLGVRSANRHWSPPGSTFNDIGVRPARTFK